MNKHVYYFAYGSNMNHKQMKNRVGDLGSIEIVGAFYLNGYDVVLNKKGGKKDVCYANLQIGNSDSCSLGIVYKLNRMQLDRLSEYEGGYNIESIEVNSVLDDSPLTANVYIAMQKNIATDNISAEKSYVDKIRSGMRSMFKPKVVNDYIDKMINGVNLV